MGNITWNLAYSSFPYMFLSYSSFSCNSQHEEIGANKKERVSALDGLIDGYMGGWGVLNWPIYCFFPSMDGFLAKGGKVCCDLSEKGGAFGGSPASDRLHKFRNG